LGVLPAGIGGLFVGGIAVNLFFWLQSWFIGIGENSGWAQINYYIFSSVASSILAVYWGTRVAPSGKKIVALVLGGSCGYFINTGCYRRYINQTTRFILVSFELYIFSNWSWLCCLSSLY